MTDDPSWDIWFNTAVKDVKAARKNGVVTIYNQEYLPTREYTFKNAWPISAQGHRHERQHRHPIEETVTFVYEEIEATQP